MFGVRKAYRELGKLVCGIQQENNQLKEENAKLRKLMLELWTYAEQELLCDRNCQYGAVCDWRDCVFKRRMRELGVEAPDD